MANLLIVGGTGFFGKSILDAFHRGLLCDFGVDQVIAISRNKQRFEDAYPDLLGENVEIIEGDIAHMQMLPKADLIIYAAASTNIQEYEERGEQEWMKMQQSVLNFCKLVQEFCQHAKVVLCSSGAVYGKQPLALETIPETFPLPLNVSELSLGKQWYLKGKRFAEEQFIHLGVEQVPVAIARCFAFFGKYLPKDQHYAYGNFIGEAEKGKNILVEAPGLVYRSYMEADDLVKSLLIIANAANNTCPIYNVGSDKSISLYDLAESIARDYGVKCEYKNLNKELIVDRYVPNTAKLKQLVQNYGQAN